MGRRGRGRYAYSSTVLGFRQRDTLPAGRVIVSSKGDSEIWGTCLTYVRRLGLSGEERKKTDGRVRAWGDNIGILGRTGQHFTSAFAGAIGDFTCDFALNI